MKMYRENFGFNNFNKKLMLSMFSVSIFFFVAFLSVGFSAFQTSLVMKDISADVKLDVDTRVYGFSVSAENGNAEASNSDNNYNRIYGDVVLPTSDSTVVYEVQVINLGNTKVGIADITGLDSSLTYTLTGYTLGEAMKDEDGQYKLGAIQTFYITIGYAEGATPTSSQQSFNLLLDFKPFHTITYHGVPGEESHPTEILEGQDLVITTELTRVERLKITMDTVLIVKDEHYTYDETTYQLTIKNVTGDLLLSYRENAYLVNLSSDSAFFKKSYKTSIKNVEFVNYIDVTNAVATYDLTQSGEANSIVGWVTSNGDSTYNLYIGSVYDIYTTNFNSAFKDMTGIESISFKNLNTSQSTSFAYTFFNTQVTNLDLSTFNTASATTMLDMFGGMTQLETLDVSNFNTSNVTNMYFMFGGLSKIKELDISSFDTSSVTNMGYMFSGMTALEELNLGSNFNTSQVVDMQYMFSGLSSLATIDLSTFKTEQVLNAKYMFSGCSSLVRLDLSTFKTSTITNMQAMFYGCSKLTSLDLSTFTSEAVTNMQSMFEACSALTELNLSGFDFASKGSASKFIEGVPYEIVVTVLNEDSKTWVEDKLAGKGTVVIAGAGTEDTETGTETDTSTETGTETDTSTETGTETDTSTETGTETDTGTTT